MQFDKQWSFFRTPNGKVSYHPKCLRCIHGCKQSWRVKTLICPRFCKAG